MNKESKLPLLLLATFLLLTTGCGESGSSPDKTSPDSNKAESNRPRVALIMKSLANEFFSTMADGAKSYQAENAEQFELMVNGIKDERDLSRQAALVDEMVASGMDAIVIAPADSKALIPVLRRAQKAGVVIVNIDNRLDADTLTVEGIQIPFVGPDNRVGARKTAEYLVSKLNKGDAVAILEGIRTSFNGQQRRLGFEDAMASGMKIVASQSASWEMSQANTIASAMLSEHPEIKAILACNDSMALGAAAAVKSAGRTGEIYVIGFDNISAVQQSILDGKILATADQHGDKLAIYGIQKALAMLNKPAEQSADRETPVDLITVKQLQ